MPNQDRDALPHLLARCTARLVVNRGAGETGTGFFVAPGYLLTCAHVVASASKGQATAEAIWNGNAYPATLQQITDEGYPDLALLNVNGIDNHPCVYLYDELHLTDELYTYGYPPKYPAGDSIISRYVGPTGEPQALLTFTESNVRRGFSGSPLLNLRAGAVCGLVKLTTGENSLLGGRGVPIAQALQAFPQIKALHEQFHRENHEWARLLTPQQRQVNGLDKLAPQTEAVTLFFSYHENKQDLKMFESLQLQLATLRRNGLIKDWHLGKLTTNVEARDEILKQLDAAQIILLLVSPHYIADEELYREHVERAMQRRADGKAIVIPILVRPTESWEDTAFGKLIVIPRNKVPMSKWSNRDEAAMTIASEIKRAAETLRKPKS